MKILLLGIILSSCSTIRRGNFQKPVKAPLVHSEKVLNCLVKMKREGVRQEFIIDFCETAFGSLR
jgi:hypothetical protein